MKAVQELVQQEVSLNKALRLCGITRKRWYYKPRTRKYVADQDILQEMLIIRQERQFYGTRRMAAELSRRLGKRVNRKQVRHIYRENGWNQPKRTKNRARWTPIRATRPNEVWETDITYIWCGSADGWCYCFNILDIFTRQWITYRFSTIASADVAVESLVEAVSLAKPDCSKLVLQCDNGVQYSGKKFRKAASLLGINLKFIRTHTPEQNGHIESFHGTLKREYIWPYDFANYQEAEAAIACAFQDYNKSRIHSSLKYVPPMEFLAAWEAKHK